MSSSAIRAHGAAALSALAAAWLSTLMSALLSGALLAPATLHAETIVIDDKVTVRASDVPRPAPGMTMKAVEQRFGAPQERHAAVGAPPITRWDYPAFAVFFERDRVIDAVVLPAP